MRCYSYTHLINYIKKDAPQNYCGEQGNVKNGSRDQTAERQKKNGLERSENV